MSQATIEQESRPGKKRGANCALVLAQYRDILSVPISLKEILTRLTTERNKYSYSPAFETTTGKSILRCISSNLEEYDAGLRLNLQ